VIVPGLKMLLEGADRDQVTALLKLPVPATEAVNCVWFPIVAEAGLGVTATDVIADNGVCTCEPPFPPPPQAATKLHKPATIQRAAFLPWVPITMLMICLQDRPPSSEVTRVLISIRYHLTVPRRPISSVAEIGEKQTFAFLTIAASRSVSRQQTGVAIIECRRNPIGLERWHVPLDSKQHLCGR
jgi:hypothetical protein